MKSRRPGFTLIELMIVVAIIAIIAAITIPSLLEARRSANETTAIATLRNISSAQAQYSALIETRIQKEGSEEKGPFYAEFADLAGGDKSISGPPVLSSTFAKPEKGVVPRSGYRFRLRVPEGGQTWVCYAWPVNYRNSGTRTFVIGSNIGEAGTVYAYDPKEKWGEDGPPDNAFDLETWEVVN